MELQRLGANDAERTDALALEIEAFSNQLCSVGTERDVDILLANINGLETELGLLLSSADFYNGNVKIKSVEDFTLYHDVLGATDLQYINGYLEIEIRQEIQGLSYGEEELGQLLEFTSKIKGVTRSVYLSVDVSLDLASMENLDSIYRVHGADVLDDNLTVVGGMVLDYHGDYVFPKLRQVNGYTFNLENGFDEEPSMLATPLLPLKLLIGQPGLEWDDSLQNVSFGYGAILINAMSADYSDMDNKNGKKIDFSALEVSATIYSPRIIKEFTGFGSLFSFFSGIFQFQPVILAPNVNDIDLGHGIPICPSLII